jgi:hypothetical protein
MKRLNKPWVRVAKPPAEESYLEEKLYLIVKLLKEWNACIHCEQWLACNDALWW